MAPVEGSGLWPAWMTRVAKAGRFRRWLESGMYWGPYFNIRRRWFNMSMRVMSP
jgi:hypothetical protein